MAFPLALLAMLGGGISSIAGINMQNRAAADQQRAVTEAKRAEFARQEAFRDQSTALGDKAVEELAAAPDAVDQNRAKLIDMFRSAASQGQEEGEFATSSAAAQADAAARGEAVQTGLDNRGAAMANLGATGKTFGDIGLSSKRRNTDLASILGRQSASAALLPMELESAMGVGQEKAAMGQFLGALGQTAMRAGMAPPGSVNMPFKSQITDLFKRAGGSGGMHYGA